MGGEHYLSTAGTAFTTTPCLFHSVTIFPAHMTPFPAVFGVKNLNAPHLTFS
jgi:hypothetical protein